jgi:hypothetical protein
MNYVPYRRTPTAGMKIWLPPLVITWFLWWFSPNAISIRELLMALVLLLFPWTAYADWQRKGKTRIPLLALISLAYWAAYAMPLFLGDPPADPNTRVPFGEATVFRTMEMAVAGMAALAIGMRLSIRPLNPAMMPDISESPGTWRYLYCLLAIGSLLAAREDFSYALGAGGHQFILALAGTVPLAICAMLAIKRMEGTATNTNKIALTCFVVMRVLIGIASGWMGSVVFIGVILTLIHTSRSRRLPVRAILIVVPVVLFLQVGKGAFRGQYWTGTRTGGVIEKAEFWLTASFSEWSSVFRSHDTRGTHALLSESLERVDLLSQAANVMEKTPGVVPFQEGASYTFLVATLVPRAVWPDKPSVNDANRFYQVAYGLTAKDDLEGVAISVGCLAESFMNFSWWGVVVVMFVNGFLVGVFERTLLTAESGLLFSGIGLALLPGLLTIESQAAQYIGGILQQIAVVFVVVLPVVRRRKMRHQSDLYMVGEART